MKIDIVGLNPEIVKFSNLLKQYNELYLNIYNKIKEIEKYWNGPYSVSFMDNIEKEKQKISLIIEDLSTVNSLYKYIYDSYKGLGKNIYFDENNSDTLIKKFDSYLQILNIIITKYNSINTNYYNEVRETINVHKSKINAIKDQTMALKSKNNEMILKLNKIEENIKTKLDNIEIGTMSATNISEYYAISGNNNIDAWMDVLSIQSIIELLEIYYKEEQLIVNDLKEVFGNFNSLYNTSNSSKLKLFNLGLVSCLENVILVHKNNLMVLNDNIDKLLD